MTSPEPTLLTADEAAAIARCSVKTVRRAYANGALLAYRRRGSRAVLLDRQDVVEWVRSQIIEPVKVEKSGDDSGSEPSEPQRSLRRTRTEADGPRSGSERRVDLSVGALRDRRSLRVESLL
jgi:excisionase family DNA binding protein